MRRLLILFVSIFLTVGGFSQQASYRWGNVAIGGGGFVSSVVASAIEPGLFYARTDVGGAYRWDEASQTWISIMDWVNTDERGLLGVEAIAIDPVQKGRVYLMTGTVYWNQAQDGIGRSAFLRSDDYGATWEKIYVWDDATKYFNVHGNGMGRGTGERLAVDPANTDCMFYGSRNKGLWKSTNRGSSWTKVSSFPVDTTWNGCGISFVAFDSSTKTATATQRIYVGVLRNQNNLFVSEDAGKTWSLVPNRPIPQYASTLMPQRIAIRPDGSEIYVTWGNGAGPHTMQWDEGWGKINDWFNRGAVLKYQRLTKTWTNISPQNLIDPAGEAYTDPSTYFGCYSGVSVNPQNPNILVVSSIASYRGTQYWKIDGKWKDVWGDNIFVSPDAGKTWTPAFRYYWVEGGYPPTTELMDANGFPWIVGNTIHWIGGVCIDPFNPKRVFVTSGNGVFATDDIMNYKKFLANSWDKDSTTEQNTVWKFMAKGIEEVVPDDIVSMKNGPVLSAIWDYDGFVHSDVTKPSPFGRYQTGVSGTSVSLGSTPGITVASKSGRAAKVAKIRSVKLQYNSVPIGPVQYSADSGKTWTVETYISNPPTALHGGKVALSPDGTVTLWMPADSTSNATTGEAKQATSMYRNENSGWTVVKGINFNTRPVADATDNKRFYAFNNSTGYMFVSNDGGKSFTQAAQVGESDYKTIRATPDSTGHIWVPLAKVSASKVRSGGLKFSTDAGVSFKSIPDITYCEAVGFGKAAVGANYPTIYVLAQINGIIGVYRSTDKGESWTRINDEEHEYGGLANGEFVVGDMNVFGRVYMSTAGRGIVCGEEGTALETNTQYIDLVAGWNLITVNRIAANMNISTLFPNAKVVKNDSTFFGSWQNNALNSLTSITAGEAYFVYNTVDEQIKIKGTAVSGTAAKLHAGWNLLGYPKLTNGSITTLLSPIASKTNCIKNFNGFWLPSTATVSSLNSFEPGKGYFIHVTESSNLTW